MSNNRKNRTLLEPLLGILSMGYSPAGLIYYLFRRKKLSDLETTFISGVFIEFLGLGAWIITIIGVALLFRFFIVVGKVHDCLYINTLRGE